MFQHMQAPADTFAHPPRLTEYRYHQALAEEEHGGEHHAEERQDKFTGDLIHDCPSIHSGRNRLSGNSMPRLPSTSRKAGTMPVGR
ncbi:hypothetical protein D3C85_1259390 [compost metagenome]